jgi:hypothetical protein
MAALAQRLADVLSPWVDLYSGSTPVETAVMFLHLGGLVAAGGLAWTLDRAVLRSARGPFPSRVELARELGLAHGAVLVGLGVVVVSGVALAAADPKTFLVSWLFWTKMALVALLLGNGWVLKRAGERLAADPDADRAFRSLRGAALRSVGLWALTLLAGVALSTTS